MKTQKYKSSTEGKVLIGMITDPIVLGRIASKWTNKDKMFRHLWSNLIAKWCVDYFLKYSKAPNKAIEGLYESWASSSDDTDTIQLVDKFLASLSEKYEDL